MKVCIYDAPSAKEECIFHTFVDCLDDNAFEVVKKSMCQFTSCPSGCICEKDGEFNFGSCPYCEDISPADRDDGIIRDEDYEPYIDEEDFLEFSKKHAEKLGGPVGNIHDGSCQYYDGLIY